LKKGRAVWEKKKNWKRRGSEVAFSLEALIPYHKIKRMTETEKKEEEGKNTDNFKDYIVADYTFCSDYKYINI
jgi:hypothetical protein